MLDASGADDDTMLATAAEVGYSETAFVTAEDGAALDVRYFMRARDWTTINLVWQETLNRYHSRNLFPPGGVVEDPATGAAAAAFGGYLREHALTEPNATVSILQGDDMGRPSRISVTVPAEPGSGIAVSGTAVRLAHEATPVAVRHPSRQAD